jgi:hypothetical protein
MDRDLARVKNCVFSRSDSRDWAFFAMESEFCSLLPLKFQDRNSSLWSCCHSITQSNPAEVAPVCCANR